MASRGDASARVPHIVILDAGLVGSFDDGVYANAQLFFGSTSLEKATERRRRAECTLPIATQALRFFSVVLLTERLDQSAALL